MERMPVPEAQEGSWEDLLHRASGRDKLLLLAGADEPVAMQDWRGHRAIGVVYRPEYERGNYVPTVLPRRYDSLLYLDETQALHALPVRRVVEEEVPETFPSGVLREIGWMSTNRDRPDESRFRPPDGRRLFVANGMPQRNFPGSARRDTLGISSTNAVRKSSRATHPRARPVSANFLGLKRVPAQSRPIPDTALHSDGQISL
jgi:hypothetical protein